MCPRTSPYAPIIAVPPEVTTLDPAWASCSAWYGGLYDPPTALQPANAIATPTIPSMASTTPASPSTPAQGSLPIETVTAADPATRSSQASDPSVGSASQSVSTQGATQPAASTPSPSSNVEQATQSSASSPNVQSKILPTAAGVSSASGSDPGSDGAEPQTNDAADTTNSPQSATIDGSSSNQLDSSDFITQQALTATASAGTDPARVIASLLVASTRATDTAAPDPTVSTPNVGNVITSVLGLTETTGVRTNHAGNQPASSTPQASDPGFTEPAGNAEAPSSSTSQSANSAYNNEETEDGSTTVFTAADSVHTVVAQSGTLRLDGSVVDPGITTIVGSQVISIGTSAVLAGTNSLAYSAGVPSITPIASFTVNGQIHTVQQQAGSLYLDGSPVGAGDTTTVDSEAVSFGSDQVYVGSSTVISLPSDDTTSPTQVTGAVFTADEQIYTALEESGSTVIDGITVPIGHATSFHGAAVSVASAGLVLDGITAQFSAVQATQTPATVLHFGGSAITALTESGSAVDINGNILHVGQETTISGTPVSLGSSGLVVGTSIIRLLSAAETPTTTPSAALVGAVFVAGDSTLTASQLDGEPGTVVVAGQTLSAGGPALVLASHTISEGLGGLVIDGTSTAALSDIALAPTAGTGVVLTFDGNLITASEAAGHANTVVFSGHTLSVGGPVEVIDGQTFSLGAAGVLVGSDGHTSTAAFATSTEQIEAIVAAGAETLTAYRDPQNSNAIDIGSTTLYIGGPALTADNGETISMADNGLVIASSGHTSTVRTSGGAEATVIVGSDILPVYSDPAGPSAVVVGGSTISVGGPAITINGVAVSDASQGLVVGGTTTVRLLTTISAPSSSVTSTGQTLGVAAASTSKKSEAKPLTIGRSLFLMTLGLVLLMM